MKEEYQREFEQMMSGTIPELRYGRWLGIKRAIKNAAELCSEKDDRENCEYYQAFEDELNGLKLESGKKAHAEEVMANYKRIASVIASSAAARKFSQISDSNDRILDTLVYTKDLYTSLISSIFKGKENLYKEIQDQQSMALTMANARAQAFVEKIWLQNLPKQKESYVFNGLNQKLYQSMIINFSSEKRDEYLYDWQFRINILKELANMKTDSLMLKGAEEDGVNIDIVSKQIKKVASFDHKEQYPTLVVNFFGGAGAGKTQCAWAIAAALKEREITVEYVPEFAKELVWDNRMNELQDQHYVTDTQYQRLERLRGKVDVIVTDSPVLLGIWYGGDRIDNDYRQKILNYHNSFDSFNLFVERDKDSKFEQAGRIHNEKQSKQADVGIQKMLDEKKIYYGIYDRNNKAKMVNNIITTLSRINPQSLVHMIETFGETGWRVLEKPSASQDVKKERVVADIKKTELKKEGSWSTFVSEGENRLQSNYKDWKPEDFSDTHLRPEQIDCLPGITNFISRGLVKSGVFDISDKECCKFVWQNRKFIFYGDIYTRDQKNNMVQLFLDNKQEKKSQNIQM